jgi:tyrosyl-tRNA synthetase
MYGKTLSLPDPAMADWFRLLLGRPAPASLAPRDAKRLLARELVARFHSPEAAARAEAEFDRVHVDLGEPDEIDELAFAPAGDGSVHLPELIAGAFGVSRSEARRLIAGGGVQVDGAVVDTVDVPAASLAGRVLRVGKRRFRRLVAA